MRRSRNFHERGSNENGNFLVTGEGGGSNPPKILKLPFFKVKFSISRGGPDPRSPPPPSGSAHVPASYDHNCWWEKPISTICYRHVTFYILAYVYTYIGSAKLHFHVFFVNAQKTLYMYTWHDLRFET